MDDKAKTIGMDELLQEITERLKFLKDQKHPKAYDIALWWEQEKQMLGLKYSIVNCAVESKPKRSWKWKKRYAVPGRWLDLFLIVLAIGLAVVLLLR